MDKPNYQNPKGMTLVEILISIVIINVIIISIFMLFIQSSRTNNISENIADATYMAQSYMEEIYKLSLEGTTKAAVNKLQTNSPEMGFVLLSSNDEQNKYELEKQTDNHLITISFQREKVLVKIYENKDEKKLVAQMENYLKWQQ